MTTTLAPAEAGLLRAICEDPADDTPRLIYADWLDEHGHVERAEFIRVQIELAEREVAYNAGVKFKPYGLRKWVKKRRELEERERKLLEAHGFFWHPPGITELHISGPVTTATERFVLGVFRRGFVAEVCCTLADWYGRGCPDCGAARHLEGQPGWKDFRAGYCERCDRTGRVSAHGPAIVAASPIEVVRLTDCEPHPVDGERGRYFWIKDRDYIPEPLFDLLKCDDWLHGASWKRYPSKQVALDALSQALLTWARKIAGLPV